MVFRAVPWAFQTNNIHVGDTLPAFAPPSPLFKLHVVQVHYQLGIVLHNPYFPPHFLNTCQVCACLAVHGISLDTLWAFPRDRTHMRDLLTGLSQATTITTTDEQEIISLDVHGIGGKNLASSVFRSLLLFSTYLGVWVGVGKTYVTPYPSSSLLTYTRRKNTVRLLESSRALAVWSDNARQ